jgi:DNA-directed RNA polymerase subunit M
MMFCPKCGAILIPKKEKNKIIISCSCGYTESKKTPKTPVKFKEVFHEGQKVETVDKEVEIYPLTHDSECPKCGNNAAYFWEMQTRASDEPATKFMKCQKCKHIWRDYK